jgi:hypothetical protein
VPVRVEDLCNEVSFGVLPRSSQSPQLVYILKQRCDRFAKCQDYLDRAPRDFPKSSKIHTLDMSASIPIVRDRSTDRDIQSNVHF